MAWQRILTSAVIGSALAFGCTVTTGDGDNDLLDSDGGINGTTNGTADAGANGASNGAGNGADGGTNGTTNGVSNGTDDGGANGMEDAGQLLTLIIDPDDAACDDCVRERCEPEYLDCNSDECAGTCTTPECDGSGEMVGESRCIHDYIDENKGDAGATEDLFNEALAECAQDDIGIGSDQTLDLLECVFDPPEMDAGFSQTKCGFECFSLDFRPM